MHTGTEKSKLFIKNALSESFILTYRHVQAQKKLWFIKLLAAGTTGEDRKRHTLTPTWILTMRVYSYVNL